MAFQIRILTGSTVPIYRQIADQVRHAIATRRLDEGDPLPSVRALAEELVLNPNTVARAYSDLVRDGVLESQQGRGVIVAAKRQIYTKTERLRRLEPALSALVHEAVALGFSGEEVAELLQEKVAELGLDVSRK